MKTIDLQEALYTKQPLKFDENGKFRILMVSDIHGGVGYNAKQTIQALQALVDEAKPHLVLLGGDIAGPGMIHIETAQQLREMLDGMTSPMEKAGIPWAHVYGNHDDNYGLTNAEHQVVYESYPYCVSKAGPEDIPGVGNYVLPVWDAKGETILFNVFGLDSHRYLRDFREDCNLPEEMPIFEPTSVDPSGESPIRFKQIMWYYQTSEALEAHAGHKIPALMYMHVPLPEHNIVCLHKDACRFRGNHMEDVSCSRLNSGLFTACLQRGDVKAIFCGHDHVNDFEGTYCGIKLGFDGFMSYHACHNNEIRGGRLFEISAEDPANIETKMLRVRDLLGPEGDSIP